jgi:ribosomal protein S18 acetylase RimI-like enzyme
MLHPMTFEPASTQDIERIAQLHAQSWKTAYRGILSDEYLDHRVEADRLTVWHERLTNPAPNQYTLVAEEGGELRGFVCAFGNKDERWGTYIDNLHVRPDLKGRGLGRQLMQQVAHWSAKTFAQPKIHLLVLEDNHPAKAFYDRVGGQCQETFTELGHDGLDIRVCRYVWERFEG